MTDATGREKAKEGLRQKRSSIGHFVGCLVIARRIIAVTVITVGLLVPSLSSPARTIFIPRTIAASALLTNLAPRAVLDFRPTHIAFSWSGDEGTGVRYRLTSSTGNTTRWRRAPEAHDAERGARHFSGVLTVDRPVAVEYEPIRPRGTTMSSVTLDYLNTVDGPKQPSVVPAVAHAAAETPAIVTRAEWGADESLKRTDGSCTRRFFDVQQLFVHHTAGSNNDPDPFATMRAIYWYHAVRQGWCDVGYNFVVSQDGTVFEGRWARRYAPWETHSSENLDNQAVAGAHVSGYNSGSVGVSVMGNFSRMRPPPAIRQALAEFLAWETDRHDLDPMARHTYVNPETGTSRSMMVIAGHRAAGQTECPGTYLGKALAEIRRDTAIVMGEGKASTVLTLSASSTAAGAGDPVDYTGRLTDAAGAGLISQPVTLYQRLEGGRWAAAGEVLTGIDGSYRFSTTATATATTRAVYGGGTTTWGSQSENVRVVVS
ncbi:MAG TPA: N-acetylmuramoyl-L-alanine amidase [Actinomycetota bacterium]|nr:N-acetylmuramoyl-L-alanine amidase [Actinomycetota bacterium]